MKKSFAIMILALYLFNLTGYPLLFNFLMDRAGRNLAVKLDDNNYDESKLLEIKVPLHSQYIVGNNTYERFEGETEVNGVTYTYVKRKMSGDTLYLQYIPNEQGTKILTAKSEFDKESAGTTAGKKQNTQKKGGPSLPYNNKLAEYSFTSPGQTFTKPIAYTCAFLPNSFIATAEQPPDGNFFPVNI